MKIFGIGLSKTGTTSLAEALKILGYKTVHNPMRFVSLKNSILSLDYSQVDQYEALTDIQIARFFKELDLRYPGSKFVLTTRDIDGWLDSCRNHFNQYRSAPNNAKALNSSIYGTYLFDAEKFREAYMRHYADVISYFSNRNSDLLLLDLREENKWEKLCNFLSKSIPNKSYPLKNKALPVPGRLKNLIRRFSVGRKLIKVIKRKSS
jgi:hypothetical protein